MRGNPADTLQQQRNRASALRALAGLKAMVGDFGEARELVDAHKAIVQELGLVTAAAAAETYGIVEMLAGDAAAAERELATGYALLDEIGETQNFPISPPSSRTRSTSRGTTIERSS